MCSEQNGVEMYQNNANWLRHFEHAKLIGVTFLDHPVQIR